MAETLDAKLVFLSGERSGKEFALGDKTLVTLGRSDENDLMMADSSVSRRHVSFVFENNRWHVRDENSRNATFLNEEKIDAGKLYPLSNQKVVRCGIYDIRYVDNAPKQERELDSGNDEVDELEQLREPFRVPGAGRAMMVFVVIIVACLAFAAIYYFGFDRHLKRGGDSGTATETSTVILPTTTGTSAVDEVLSAGTTTTTATTTIIGDPNTKVTSTATSTATTSVVAIMLDTTTSAPTSDVSLFLDVRTEPLPATIYLGETRLGLSPLKRSVTVKALATQTLYADFDLREIKDVYRKKVEFSAKPGTDVLEFMIDGEIGVLNIQKLPRRVEFYLEGYYDYDKIRANPVKITDIVYGKPIYLPYGTYVVELKEKTKIAGSDNEITQVRFQRQYIVSKENRTLSLNVTDKDLQQFPAVIKSIPSNATVFYNDEKMGVTPFTGTLPLGPGKLKLVKEGFFDAAVDLDMRMNSVYETTITLKTSKTGELINNAKELIKNDQTQPAIDTLIDALKYGGSPRERAEIYLLLGNAYLAQNNLDLARPYFEKSRDHEEFYMRGGMGLAKVLKSQNLDTEALKTIVSVLVNFNESTPQDIRGEAKAAFKQISPYKSVLYIYTDPPGAKVSINEKPAGKVTPVILNDIDMGSSRILVEKAGYKSYLEKQNIQAGEFVMIKLKLVPEVF